MLWLSNHTQNVMGNLNDETENDKSHRLFRNQKKESEMFHKKMSRYSRNLPKRL